MPILVDSNVVLDVVTEDPVWADWSDEAITRHQAGGLIVNPIIYSELCTGAESRNEVDELLESLKLVFHEIPRDGLHLASKAFLRYRRQGGTKAVSPACFPWGHHERLPELRLMQKARCNVLSLNSSSTAHRSIKSISVEFYGERWPRV